MKAADPDRSAAAPLFAGRLVLPARQRSRHVVSPKERAYPPVPTGAFSQ